MIDNRGDKKKRSPPKKSLGTVVPKGGEFASVANTKKYSESGRVVDDGDHEKMLALAMKARRARRDEIIGVNKQAPSRARSSTLKIPRIEKKADHYKLIKRALDNNILFNDCSAEQVDHIIYAMKPKKIAKKTKIIVEGDEGFNFYIVQKGRFQYTKDGNVLGEAKGGESFGELALLYYAPRATTVTAMANSEVWKLDRVTFRQILDSSNQVKNDRIRSALKKTEIFGTLTSERLEQIVDCGLYQSFRKGDVIIRKDDVGQIFYVIVAGRVQVTRAGDLEELNDTIFGPGDYFGESALLNNARRNANVIAIEDCDLLALDKQAFEKYVGSFVKLLDRNMGLRVLKSVELLKDMQDEQFEDLCNELLTETHKAGKFVFKQGQTGKKFYIIKSGRVEISREEEDSGESILISTLGTGAFFGEIALLDNTTRNASALAATDLSLFTLDRKNFERLFGPLETLAVKKRERKKQMKKTSKLFASAAARRQSKTPEKKIKFNDLRQLQLLGTGTFGNVVLVQHIHTEETYAFKILQKQQIVDFRQQDNVMNEKQILKQSNHPFILRLFETYQDQNCLYMLLELVQGGELFMLLHTKPENKLEDHHAKFYASCVIDAMHYLHDLNVIYRDLKPENLMIDTAGYIKVVDFGFAKEVKQKTYTLCGTPEYLAPELVLQKGHNKAVDYWAVGILIFEMLSGASPFADQRANEHITICRNIVRGAFVFPHSFPEGAKDIVKRLLEKYPHKRIGMKTGTQEIKKHPWFKEVDWKALRDKEVETPWQPEIRDKLDTTHFDAYEEEVNHLSYTEASHEWAKNF